MAKKNTSATPPKADIDFENDLWNPANELRGAVAENRYKDFVLSPGRFVSSEVEESETEINACSRLKAEILPQSDGAS